MAVKFERVRELPENMGEWIFCKSRHSGGVTEWKPRRD